jgi:hypothetical protein
MEDLVIDVCILMSGSGIGNDKFQSECYTLMKKMISDPDYYLAVDNRKKISQQYDNKCKAGTFGRYFFTLMESKDKVIPIPWIDINKNVKVSLHTKGFTQDNEDYKYVVVANSTCCKKLVSHEPHFFRAQNILKRLPINVLYPQSA